MPQQRFKVEEGVEAYGDSIFVGNVNVTDTLYIGGEEFEFNTNSISVVANTTTVVDEYDATKYGFAKYFITAKTPDGARLHALEAIVINRGTETHMTQYGFVWNNEPLMDIATDIVSGKVRVLATPRAAVPFTVSTYRTIQS